MKLINKNIDYILCFAGTNSKESINRKLLDYAVKFIKYPVKFIDINDYEMPIYGIDREKKYGIPEEAKCLKEYIDKAIAFIIALPEHNGSYTVAFKNILDWTSRIDRCFWGNKPMFLCSASVSQKEQSDVLKTAKERFPLMKADIRQTFYLKEFNSNFSQEKGIFTNREMEKNFSEKISQFIEYLQTLPR